jgi:hypothetical protein
LSIGLAEITPGKTEIINGIQQVGFAHAIASANTNNGFCKSKGRLRIIFILKEGYIT